MAEQLGMTVARLRVEMDQGEYVHWCAYYARRAQREDLEAKKAKRGRR